MNTTAGPDEIVVPLRAERAELQRQTTITGRVTVSTVTQAREELVEAMLTSEQVEIERREVRELVDAMPEVREEGDVIVIPVVEEVLVTERRLFLKEEVRIRRVRTTQLHRETVTLREQEAVITRAPPEDTGGANATATPTTKEARMASETIVAVFETAQQAHGAIDALQSAGIPSSAIQHYSQTDSNVVDTETVGATEQKSQGFWSWLTGEEQTSHHNHATLYDRSIESGGTVVTVITDDRDAERIVSVLETHSPIDLEERGAQYGLAGSEHTSTGLTAGAPLGTPAATPATGTAGTGTAGMSTGATGTGATGTAGTTEEVIPLAEETLEVGKRQVDRGTTRLRRYVVERPIEEQIRLRNETVSVFRRPASGAATIGADAFTDKTVEVRETAEEAVVAKNARIVEEVVVKKGVEERVETVRDTVRREEVEIDGSKDRLQAAANQPPIDKR